MSSRYSPSENTPSPAGSRYTESMDSLQRLQELAEEVDREFARIRSRYDDAMQCRSGCSACCRARLSITRVEEAFLRRGLGLLQVETRQELAAAASDEKREVCPALDEQGRCRVYESRPLICRSYGVPLRHRREVPLVNPPVIDVCDLNFVQTDLNVLPAEDVMDQTSIDAKVAEIDADHCTRNRLPQGERITLATIFKA